MANRAERRAQKLQPKRFTQHDIDQAVSKATTAIAKYNVRITLAACGLVLHRQFGFGRKRLKRVFEGIDTLSFNTLHLDELRDQLWEETKFDLKFLEDRAMNGGV